MTVSNSALNKYRKVEIENKTYIIGKIPGFEVLRIMGLMGFVSAKPIGSLICTLFYGNEEEKEKALTMLNFVASNKEMIKENIYDIFATIKENFELIKDITCTILSNVKIEIKNDDGSVNETVKFDFEKDFDFDNLDEIIDIIIEAFRLNLETGLKKAIKKYQFLGLELKDTLEEKKQ